MVLDPVNLRLLEALQANARLSSAQISTALGLSQSACLDRWRKLEKRGIIRQYRAEVDLDRIVSAVRVMAEVSFHGRGPDDLKRFVEDCLAAPEVVALYQISGVYDLQVGFVCRDVGHYHDVSEGLIARHPAITRFSGHVVLRRIKAFAGYPLTLLAGPGPDAEREAEPQTVLSVAPAPGPAPGQAPGPVTGPVAGRFRLDPLHIRILQALQTDGRLSNLALAEAVALSPSPCLERVKKLESHGYISRIFAEIDLDRCLPHVHLMAEVSIGSHGVEEFRRFEAAIATIPEVVSAYKIAGPFDYTMDIVCRDQTHVQAVEQQLSTLSGAPLTALRVTVVQQRLKAFSGYPLAVLLDR